MLSTLKQRIKIINQAKQFDEGFNFVMRAYYRHRMALSIIEQTLERNNYPEFYKKGAIDGIRCIKEMREKDLKPVDNSFRRRYN